MWMVRFKLNDLSKNAKSFLQRKVFIRAVFFMLALILLVAPGFAEEKEPSIRKMKLFGGTVDFDAGAYRIPIHKLPDWWSRPNIEPHRFSRFPHIEEEIDEVLVKKVIDFRTFVLDSDKVIRLLGIDSPKAVNKRKDAELEAYEFVKKLILNKRVWLAYDEIRRDDDGFLLAYMFTQSGMFVNSELIRRKLASVSFEYPFRYQYTFQELRAES